MLLKLKRQLYILSIFFLLLLTGCSFLKETYTITYYVNNKQVELLPDSYHNGDSFELPIPSLKENEEFNGWYLYEDFFGTKILDVNKRKSNLVLYGEIKNKEETVEKNYFTEKVEYSPLLDIKDRMNYDEYTDETYGVTIGLSSIGNPKVLVIPVEFTDCPAPNDMVENLKKAFFGTSEETGWESLKSYYYKSSYGKLTIDGTVLEPFNTGKSTKYYDKLQKDYLEKSDSYYNDEFIECPEYEIIRNALSYYDPFINYSDYDYNKDGYIDSLYIVYTTDYDSDYASLWWAFTNEYYTEDYEYYDNVEADYYCFLSYQFFFDELVGNKVNLNCETVIHETGHLLGLDDYYDYESFIGPDGGLGGGDMMDSNVGDHNPFSKLLMGWISPIIVTDTSTIKIKNFGKSGDSLFIFKEWNNTFFDEYLVIDFYNPDGLNYFAKGEYGLFSIPGVRIYHVNAELNNPADCYSIFEVYLNNNSDTKYKLISLIEADGRNDILREDYSEDDDLFQKGMELNKYKWSNGEELNFTIKILDINSDEATISIEYNK